MTNEELKIIAAVVPNSRIYEGNLYVIKKTGRGILCYGCPLRPAPAPLCSECRDGESAVPFFDQDESSRC